MRYVCPAAILVALSSLLPVSASAAASSSLSITNYHLFSETRQSRTVSLFTYTADLVNTGQAQPSITATLSSLVPSITVQPGFGNLHFPPVGANSTVTSTNFFAVVVDRSGNADFANLVWTFSTPVADAGPGQTVPTGTTVTLNGSKSTTPNGGGPLTYLWSFLSRPAGSAATITNPTSVMPTFVTDKKGNFVVGLTVSNGGGVDSSSVIISDTNTAPVAVAGPDQTLKVLGTVVLNGSGSFDIDSDPLTYSWTFMTVPAGSAAVLQGANTVAPTFVTDKVGTYKVRLVVNDGTVNSNQSVVTIASLVPPVANAGVAQQVNVGALVQLDGSKSTDVNGTPLTYRWSFNSFPANSTAPINFNTTIVNPTFTADLAGTYVLQLIVNDGFDDSMPATVTITTGTPIRAPIANPGMDKTVPHGATVTLDGTGSTDPNTPPLPLTYKWSLSKPPGSSAVLSNSTSAAPSFVADLPGDYVGQLIVNNGSLPSLPATVKITTTNTRPVANAGPPQNVITGTTVTLDGSRSTDADSDPLKYSWTFLSIPQGSTTVLMSPSIAFPTFLADKDGVYVLQLIVSDPFSSSDPSKDTNATVTITAAPSPAITLAPNPLNILLNVTGTLTVTIPTPAGAGGQAITLAVIDTSVVTVPPSVTIPAGATTVTASVSPAGVGTTQIFASASGLRTASTTVTVTQPSIALTISNSTVGLTQTVTGTITLSAPAPSGGISVSLTADDPTIVNFPASIAIGSGTTATFTITGKKAGLATITASSPSYVSGSASVRATTLGVILLQPGLTVVSGQSLTFPVSLVSAAPVGGATITLTSADITSLTVSPSVFIAAGTTTPVVPAQMTGVKKGNVIVTASASGFDSVMTSVTVIDGLVVSPSSLPVGTAGSAYPTTTISATGGTLPYTFSSTILPNGLIFNLSTGVLSGMPTGPGTATITVKDSSPTPLVGTLVLTIKPAQLVVTPSTLPGGTVGQAYGPVTIVASGGTPIYVFTATNLPTGLLFNTTTGVLSGTPSVAGTATITVTDSGSTPQTVSLNVVISPPALVVTPASLPGGTAGIPYTATTVSATGGTPPYILSAANLPNGLLFNTVTGVLSGTPSASGTATITVKDSGSPAQMKSLDVVIAPSTLTISPMPLPNGTVGVSYGPTTVTAAGGTLPYTFSAAGLPNGLLFNAATGVLSGTPTVTGTATITVKDVSVPQQTSSTTVTIGPALLVVTPASLTPGMAGVAYPTTTIGATGGTTPYILSVANLPTGLSFNTATGVLSGTPQVAGTATFTVKDSATPTPQMGTLMLIINPPLLVISPASLPTGAAGAAYPPTTISATGGTPPYVFSATGLPNGLLFNTATGVLSGTPSVSGTGTITVRDSAGTPQTGTRTVIISTGLAVVPSSLPNGTVNVAYPTTTLVVSGGNSPYIFSSANLPQGLSFNTSTGVLSGTPTVLGTGSVTVKDSTSGTPLSITLTVTVNPPTFVVSPTTLSNGAVGALYPTTTISATGGTLPYIFSSANIPSGLLFNTLTGVLSGTPLVAGTGTITVKDSTPGPNQNSVSLSFTINPALVIAPQTLPAGAVGSAYPATTISASGGTQPYILSVANLPNGLAFNTSTGVISGTPLAAGTATFTVKDSTSPTPLSGTVSLTINPPLVVAPASLPVGTVNVLYPSTTVSASGGTPPYILSAAGLPSGLSFNTSTGLISGTPSASGVATITVKDSTVSSPQVKTLTLTVNAPLAISPATLPVGTSGVAYPTTTVSASGGMGPYTFSSANLPTGLLFNASTGVISGTPIATGTGMIIVTDSTTPVALTTSVSLIVMPGDCGLLPLRPFPAGPLTRVTAVSPSAPSAAPRPTPSRDRACPVALLCARMASSMAYPTLRAALPSLSP